MYNSTTKEFQCDNCGKTISSYEEVWTKWKFPPQSTEMQNRPRKELEFENAPILCMRCAQDLLKKSF
ncbi:hypothetical protein [Lapidilactobacillus bayanensis]|uniref:hypothetical protein n=1 Tax=Lapidilactobacillus bayanensis TaxID=2485998 RepID=UPI000F7AA2CC|nr:hypothetical protein [Lapidilactobacillus bayanensis]